MAISFAPESAWYSLPDSILGISLLRTEFDRDAPWRVQKTPYLPYSCAFCSTSSPPADCDEQKKSPCVSDQGNTYRCQNPITDTPRSARYAGLALPFAYRKRWEKIPKWSTSEVRSEKRVPQSILKWNHFASKNTHIRTHARTSSRVDFWF